MLNVHNNFDTFYFIFVFIAVLSFASSITLSVGFIYSAKEMHELMLKHVFHWPMALFDITPLGRILNRFSKDVEAVDNVLPMIFRSGILMFFSVNIVLKCRQMR